MQSYLVKSDIDVFPNSITVCIPLGSFASLPLLALLKITSGHAVSLGEPWGLLCSIQCTQPPRAQPSGTDNVSRASHESSINIQQPFVFCENHWDAINVIQLCQLSKPPHIITEHGYFQQGGNENVLYLRPLAVLAIIDSSHAYTPTLVIHNWCSAVHTKPPGNHKE